MTQLPLVADLAADPKLVYLAAELSELLRWFPALRRPLRLVTAQTNKKRAAVAAENLATAEAADEAKADDVVHAAAAPRRRRSRETEFLAAVTGLNQAILDEFADDPERISAYQLGLSLSDLVWLPYIAAPARRTHRPAGRAACSACSPVRTWPACRRCSAARVRNLPSGAATIVSRSLDNWADWIDVNSARIKSAWRGHLVAQRGHGAARAARPGLGLAVGAHRRPGGGRAAEHGRLGAGGVVHRPGGPDDRRGHLAPVLAARA